MTHHCSALKSLLVYDSDEYSNSDSEETNGNHESVSYFEPNDEVYDQSRAIGNDMVLLNEPRKSLLKENCENTHLRITSNDLEVSEKAQNTEREHLPMPTSVVNMYKDSVQNVPLDDPVQYGGKIRSFPHEKGMWATFMYIEYQPNSEFFELLDDLICVAEKHEVSLCRNQNFHISLSRTVKLRYHWIQPFVDSLKIHLVNFCKFKVMMRSMEVYTNEESTRTFLGFKVHFGVDHLEEIVKRINRCLQEFNLPNFYEEPSFHLSGAYFIGNVEDKMLDMMSGLNVSFQMHLQKVQDCCTMSVSEVRCKIGNKLFSIPLKS